MLEIHALLSKLILRAQDLHNANRLTQKDKIQSNKAKNFFLPCVEREDCVVLREPEKKWISTQSVCPCQKYLNLQNEEFPEILSSFKAQARSQHFDSPKCSWSVSPPEQNQARQISFHLGLPDTGDTIFSEHYLKTCDEKQRKASRSLENIYKIHQRFSGKYLALTMEKLVEIHDGSSRIPRDFLQDRYPHTKLVSLSFSESELVKKLYSDSKTVGVFEQFVHNTSRFGIPLIVFSGQTLIEGDHGSENSSFASSFDTGLERVSFRDKNNKLRFASVKQRERAKQPISQVLRKGTFDRLLELLSMGQSIL